MYTAYAVRISLVVVGIFSVSVVFIAFSKHLEDIKGVKRYLRYRKDDDIIEKSADDDVDQKLIFVGGMPRSGTTLMRKMLESHMDIRCGPETHVIPDMLRLESEWTGPTHLMSRLVEAGVAPRPLNRALAKFILSIIVHHAPEAKYYCNKDPYALGRIEDVLFKWSEDIRPMYQGCLSVGSDVCLIVHYEQLVLRPVENTKRLFEFLEIPWTPEVLHHEKHVNETHLSSCEMSTDQVQRPLYLDALTKWCDEIPKDVLRDVPYLAPMMRLLGYDPTDNHPSYGEPDDFVLGKLKL